MTTSETAHLAGVEIPDRTFFRIGDVADILAVKPYVLRFWETEFPMVAPKKSQSGHRVYQKSEVETLALIQKLLYEERFSIEGARRFLKELRQDGQLKSARQKILGAAAANVAAEGAAASGGTASSETVQLAKELKRLAMTPLTEFFKY
jgi:DNA-binding transcriptional MerR regulator